MSITSRPQRLLRTMVWAAFAIGGMFGASTCFAQSGGEFVVESIASLTGAGSFYGVATRQGTDLAVEELNQAGGIGNRKIRVEYFDDASNPAEAANISRRISDSARVVLLNTLTTVSAVALPILNQLKIPTIGPQISVPRLVQENRPYTFSFFPDITKGAETMVKSWMHDQKVSSVVIVEDNGDIPSKTQAGIAAKLIAENGGQVTELLNATTGSVNFSPIISRIRSLNPTGVYLSTLSNDAAGLLGEMQKGNLKAPRAMSIASYNPAAVSAAGKGADGLYTYTYYLPTTEGGPDAQNFNQAFKKRFGTEPVMQSALAYAMTKTIFAQLRNVDLTSGTLQQQRDRIRDAIAAIKAFKGPFGTVSMGGDGVVNMTPIIVIFKDGKPTRRALPISYAPTTDAPRYVRTPGAPHLIG